MNRDLCVYAGTRAAVLIVLWIAVMVLATGCSTLNEYGIGGEPILMCKHRDGTAHLDDRLAGPDSAHASLVRRFRDGDELCAKAAPAGASLPQCQAAACARLSSAARESRPAS